MEEYLLGRSNETGAVSDFFFGIYPYICVAVLLVGSWIRFDREQYTWRSGSSELLRKRQLVVGSNLFHVSALALIVGHFFGMLTPASLYVSWGISVKDHAIAEVLAGGFFGLMCWVGTSILLHRRLFDSRVRLASSFSDIGILVIVWAQLSIGLATVPFSWMDHVTGTTLLHAATWAQKIVTFQPGAAAHAAAIPYVYRVHIVLGLTIFLLTPFSRLVHIWSAPVWYLGRRYQIVRQRFRKI